MKEIKDRTVVIEEWISATGVITVRGEIVAIKVPKRLMQDLFHMQE